MWEGQLAFAGHGWHVIAPHMRGTDGGIDDRPTASVTMDDYAADIVDLLDALHVEDAVICGLSMGGYLALALVRHAPTYIRGLILADTKSQADTPEGLEARRGMLSLVETQGVKAVAEAMIPKLLGATTLARHAQVVERVRTLITANSPESVAGRLSWRPSEYRRWSWLATRTSSRRRRTPMNFEKRSRGRNSRSSRMPAIFPTSKPLMHSMPRLHAFSTIGYSRRNPIHADRNHGRNRRALCGRADCPGHEGLRRTA
jgi:pimeloyl-ACP methyl ester carboxylesterase